MDKQTAYVEKLSAQINEWDLQLDLLKDKAKSSLSGATHEHLREIEALQDKRDEAAATLQGISTGSKDQWNEVKSGTDQVWEEVGTIIHDSIVKTAR